MWLATRLHYGLGEVPLNAGVQKLLVEKFAFKFLCFRLFKALFFSRTRKQNYGRTYTESINLLSVLQHYLRLKIAFIKTCFSSKTVEQESVSLHFNQKLKHQIRDFRRLLIFQKA